MHKYRLVAKKGEGTFSEVLKAQCIKNGKHVAIKCMKNHFESLEQVNNLREIQALRRLSPHPNIVKLLEVLYDQPTGRLALVFELMDMNIYELIRGRTHYVAEDRLKRYMYQLIKAMDHMHRNGIFHRDIKPENILITDDSLKLADYGSCRGIYSKQPYTEYISTRWYRAPECLLTDGWYSYKMDMWGVGCVFFEVASLFPLFPGANEVDQIKKIHAIVGCPPPEVLAKLKKRSRHAADFDFPPQEGSGIAKMIPHLSEDGIDLIIKLLTYNPEERLSAKQALRHPYFRDMREEEKRAAAQKSPELAASTSSASVFSNHNSQATSRRKHGKDPSKELRAEKSGRDMLPSILLGHAPNKAAAATDGPDASGKDPHGAASTSFQHHQHAPGMHGNSTDADSRNHPAGFSGQLPSIVPLAGKSLHANPRAGHHGTSFGTFGAASLPSTHSSTHVPMGGGKAAGGSHSFSNVLGPLRQVQMPVPSLAPTKQPSFLSNAAKFGSKALGASSSLKSMASLSKIGGKAGGGAGLGKSYVSPYSQRAMQHSLSMKD